MLVSGQGLLAPVSGQVAGTSIQEQTRQYLANVQAILTSAGSGLGDGGYVMPAACPVSTTSWRYGLRRI